MPKDLVKTRMQALASGNRRSIAAIVQEIYSKQGIWGFYPSYRATLAKNMPSAIVRFTIYEELKILMGTGSSVQLLMLAGGVASAVSSACSTPFDVVRTRISVGQISAGTPIGQALRNILRVEGIKGLYAGVSGRVLWSGLFGGKT